MHEWRFNFLNFWFDISHLRGIWSLCLQVWNYFFKRKFQKPMIENSINSSQSGCPSLNPSLTNDFSARSASEWHSRSMVLWREDPCSLSPFPMLAESPALEEVLSISSSRLLLEGNLKFFSCENYHSSFWSIFLKAFLCSWFHLPCKLMKCIALMNFFCCDDIHCISFPSYVMIFSQLFLQKGDSIRNFTVFLSLGSIQIVSSYYRKDWKRECNMDKKLEDVLFSSEYLRLPRPILPDLLHSSPIPLLSAYTVAFFAPLTTLIFRVLLAIFMKYFNFLYCEFQKEKPERRNGSIRDHGSFSAVVNGLWRTILALSRVQMRIHSMDGLMPRAKHLLTNEYRHNQTSLICI